MTRHPLRVTGPLLLAAAVHLTPARTAGAQSGPVRNVVLIHGALANYLDWSSAIDSLSTEFSTLSFCADFPDYPYYYAIPEWKSRLQCARYADSTVLVGHSLGGVVARDTSGGAMSVLTVGAPNGGAPITEMAIPLAGVVANAAGDTYSVMWNLLLDVWDSPYAADIAWVAALAADEYGWPAADVFDYGLSYISEYPPHALEDLAPGSSYLDSLPAAVANSAALRVAMYPGQNGGPLALDPGITQAQADTYGGYLYAGGVILETSALYLVDHIDYNSPEYLQGIVGLTSAYDLADLLENMPIIWCDAVGGGAYSCSNNDGFIPTSNQYWSESGVTNDALAGPPHTKEPAHPAVIDWISSRLCTLTLGC